MSRSLAWSAGACVQIAKAAACGLQSRQLVGCHQQNDVGLCGKPAIRRGAHVGQIQYHRLIAFAPKRAEFAGELTAHLRAHSGIFRCGQHVDAESRHGEPRP